MAKLLLLVGSSDLIIAGRGWLWVVAAKLWLVVCVASEIMACRGWLWVLVDGLVWTRMVVGGRTI